jgi:O-antigen/teichoic acid export membrane protein
MSRTRNVLGSFSWNLVNSISLFIYGFVISALIARVLGPGLYGDYTYLVWLFTVLVLVASFGSGQTITKYVAQWSAQSVTGQAASLVRRYVAVQLIAVSLFSVVLWFTLQYYPWLIDRHIPAQLLFITLLIALPATLNATFMVTLQGLQKFKSIAIVSIVNVALSLVLIIVAIWLHPSLHTFLSIVVAAQSVSLALYLFFLKDFLRLPGKVAASQLKSVLIYAMGVYFIAFFDLIVWQRSEVYFLGRFAPSREVAFYSLGYALISSTIFLVVTAFNSVLVPVFTKLFHEDQSAIAAGYYRTTKLSGLFVFPAAMGLILTAPSVIRLLYGHEYEAVASLIWVLAISVSFSAVAGSGSALMYSQSKHWFSVKLGLPLAMVNILLDLWLIPHYYAFGAAWANTITQVLGIGAGTIFVLRAMKVKAPFGALAKSLLSAVIMGMCLSLLRLLPLSDIVYLLIAVPLGLIIYTVMVVLLKVLDTTDIRMLRSVEESLSGRIAIMVGGIIYYLERFSTKSQ